MFALAFFELTAAWGPGGRRLRFQAVRPFGRGYTRARDGSRNTCKGSAGSSLRMLPPIVNGFCGRVSGALCSYTYEAPNPLTRAPVMRGWLRKGTRVILADCGRNQEFHRKRDRRCTCRSGIPPEGMSGALGTIGHMQRCVCGYHAEWEADRTQFRPQL